MLALRFKRKPVVEDGRSFEDKGCSLCAGHFTEGPRKGERYPLCLGCREEARRLAAAADPRAARAGSAAA